MGAPGVCDLGRKRYLGISKHLEVAFFFVSGQALAFGPGRRRGRPSSNTMLNSFRTEASETLSQKLISPFLVVRLYQNTLVALMYGVTCKEARDGGSFRQASDSLKTYEFAYKKYGVSLLGGPRSCLIICSSFRTAQFLWREMHGGPRQRQPPPGLRQSHMNCYTKLENIFTLTRYCLSQTVTSSW